MVSRNLLGSWVVIEKRQTLYLQFLRTSFSAENEDVRPVHATREEFYAVKHVSVFANDETDLQGFPTPRARSQTRDFVRLRWGGARV